MTESAPGRQAAHLAAGTAIFQRKRRELLLSVASPRWRHVFLAHLSRECNSPAAVETACAGVPRAKCGCSIVCPGTARRFFEFSSLSRFADRLLGKMANAICSWTTILYTSSGSS